MNNKNKKIIFLTIIFILSVLVIYYMYSKNKIKTSFSIENIKLVKDEEYKKSYLDYDKEGFYTDELKNMPIQEKKRFNNHPDEYDCYELSMNVKNKSKYDAVADFISCINKIDNLWIDEELGTIAPYNVKANSTRKLSTCIICKKGTLENLDVKNIKFELSLYIKDCQVIKEIKLSN